MATAWTLAPIVVAFIAQIACTSSNGGTAAEDDSGEPEIDACDGLLEGEVCEGTSIKRYRCGAVDQIVENCTYGCEGDLSPRCCHLSTTPSCDGIRVVQRDDCGRVQLVLENCTEGKTCGGGQCVDDVCRVTVDLSNNFCTSSSGLDGWDNPLQYAVLTIDSGSAVQLSGVVEVDVPGYDGVHDITCSGHVRRDDVWAHCAASQVGEFRCTGGRALVNHSCLDVASVPGQCF
jgi:hypothetical protein